MKENSELKQLIIKKYGTIKNFAKELNIAPTTLSSIIERGPDKARAENVYQICKALNIDMLPLMEGILKEISRDSFSLTIKEKDLIEKYRLLNDELTIALIDFILKYEEHRRQNNLSLIEHIEIIEKYLPDLGVAAGSVGNELPEYGEMVKIPKTKASVYADYVVRVKGDSMEPDYYDDDIVLVKTQPDVDLGQIGIFILNGEGYIKEKGINCLISKNQKYPPIVFKESDEIKCCGLVLGKTEIVKE